MDCIQAFFQLEDRMNKKKKYTRTTHAFTHTSVYAYVCTASLLCIFQCVLHTVRISCLINALPKTKFCYAYKCLFVHDRTNKYICWLCISCVFLFFRCLLAFNALCVLFSWEHHQMRILYRNIRKISIA